MGILYVALIVLAGVAITAVAILTFTNKTSREEGSTREGVKMNDAAAVVLPQQGLNLPEGTERPNVGQESGGSSPGEAYPASTGAEGEGVPMAKVTGEDQPAQEADGQAENAEDEEDEEERTREPVEEDGILSLFRSEEVEDLDLQALTQGLEDIDAGELLKECRSIANQLSRRSLKSNQTRKAT